MIFWGIFSLALSTKPASAAPGDIYYVSPDGTATWNASRGNQDSPCSLDTANVNLSAGETALLLPGTYATNIHPAASGTEGNPITYQSFNSDTAIISPASKTLIDLTAGQSYITVRNIKLYLISTVREFFLVRNASHIIFDGIHTAIAGPDYIRYDSHFEYCTDCEIKNCYMDAYNRYLGYTTTQVVDFMGVYQCHRFYIHDNYFGTALHSMLYIASGSSYIWITKNYFSNRLRHSINIQRKPDADPSPEFILVENNTFEKVGVNNLSHPKSGERRPCHSIEYDGVRSVIRWNVFTKDDQGLTNINPADYSPMSQTWVYNNIYYRMQEYSPNSASGRSIQLTGAQLNGINNNQIINNIFYYPANSLDMNIYDGGTGVGAKGFTNNGVENNIMVKYGGSFQGTYFGTTYNSLESMDNAVNSVQ